MAMVWWQCCAAPEPAAVEEAELYAPVAGPTLLGAEALSKAAGATADLSVSCSLRKYSDEPISPAKGQPKTLVSLDSSCSTVMAECSSSQLELRGTSSSTLQTSRRSTSAGSDAEAAADEGRQHADSIGSADGHDAPKPVTKRTHFSGDVEEFENDAVEWPKAAPAAEDGPVRQPSVISHTSVRSTNMVWTASHRIRRRMSRRHSTLRSASRPVPQPRVPRSARPIHSGVLAGADLDMVRGALLDVAHCPMVAFLREVLECFDISSTEWRNDDEVKGTKVRKAHWSAPLPPDISDTMARLLAMPKTITGSTVWRLQDDPETITVIQHSYTRDVLYGERFRLQSTFRFSQTDAGVLFENFAETIWVSPLPWSLTAVKVFVERKSRVDSTAASPDVQRMIEKAIAARRAAPASPASPSA